MARSRQSVALASAVGFAAALAAIAVIAMHTHDETSVVMLQRGDVAADVEARAINWFKQEYPRRAAEMGDVQVIEKAMQATKKVLSRQREMAMQERLDNNQMHHPLGMGSLIDRRDRGEALTPQQERVLHANSNQLVDDFFDRREAAAPRKRQASALEYAADSDQGDVMPPYSQSRSAAPRRLPVAEQGALLAAQQKQQASAWYHAGYQRDHSASVRHKHAVHASLLRHHAAPYQQQQHVRMHKERMVKHHPALRQSGLRSPLARRHSDLGAWGQGKGPMDEAMHDLGEVFFGDGSRKSARKGVKKGMAHRPRLPGVNEGWGLSMSPDLKSAAANTWKKDERELLRPHTSDPRKLWTGVGLSGEGAGGARLQSLAQLPSSLVNGGDNACWLLGGSLEAPAQSPFVAGVYGDE
eukprot:CAMPEP_0181320116 /NCGR_PEP_ID=MMETSP1101-20121128/17944_1 /TAXON_ID=46948 /ORGANISM="Rhodomonas abbreviata, Strain Caron Lab Isolate" /LENGTH=411 /DNA_ID=CAMNT_0023427783 /DNA_START=6 /DNA_END=1239 /DNA_ORIENTATION=+